MGKLTVVLGVLGFISERPERAKQRYYQAWELINAAKQSQGDAGRRVAIRDLIDDHVEMRRIELNNSNFENMDFRSAIMPEADFTKAEIKGADFSCKAGFYITNYWIPEFQFCWRTVLNGAEFVTEIDGNDFSRALLHVVKFGLPATPQQAEQFRNGQKIADRDQMLFIANARFIGADMDGAGFRNAMIERNNFSGTTLTNALFVKVNIQGGNSFVGAQMHRAQFFGVTFIKDTHDPPSDFTNADLTGARFDWRDLTESDLPSGAIQLCHTQLPSGISNRDCPAGR